MTVVKSVPRSEVLHIACKVTKDAGGSVGSMDLSASKQVDDTPIQPCDLVRREEQRPSCAESFRDAANVFVAGRREGV